MYLSGPLDTEPKKISRLISRRDNFDWRHGVVHG